MNLLLFLKVSWVFFCNLSRKTHLPLLWLIKKCFSLQTQKQQKPSTDADMLWMCYFDAPWLLFWRLLRTTKRVRAEVFEDLSKQRMSDNIQTVKIRKNSQEEVRYQKSNKARKEEGITEDTRDPWSDGSTQGWNPQTEQLAPADPWNNLRSLQRLQCWQQLPARHLGEDLELPGYRTQINHKITAAWQKENTGEEIAARPIYLWGKSDDTTRVQLFFSGCHGRDYSLSSAIFTTYKAKWCCERSNSKYCAPREGCLNATVSLALPTLCSGPPSLAPFFIHRPKCYTCWPFGSAAAQTLQTCQEL